MLRLSVSSRRKIRFFGRCRLGYAYRERDGSEGKSADSAERGWFQANRRYVINLLTNQPLSVPTRIVCRIAASLNVIASLGTYEATFRISCDSFGALGVVPASKVSHTPEAQAFSLL